LAIPATTKDFINNLIDYYISEASSYKQFAQEYASSVTDIAATTFGIIIGCVYSGFLQAYANQKQKPGLDDIQEFHQIIKRRTDQIKKGVLDAKE
jgi:Na+/glutamate symporter